MSISPRILSFFMLLCLPYMGLTQTREDCLSCHEDESLTMEKEGREISLFVDAARYDRSPHRSLACSVCHTGFDPDEIPHKETISPVDCSSCHEPAVASVRRSPHADLAECGDCHSNVHRDRPSGALAANCQTCHEDAAATVKSSSHGANGAGPNCLSCHQGHALATGSENCLSCHGEKEFVHRNIAHEDLKSVLAYQESIHGDLIDCSDCHTGHRVLSAGDEKASTSRQNLAATCGQCHDDIAAAYSGSEHGGALREGVADAPTCSDCHGEHSIHQITDSRSKVSRQHEIETCQKCHLDSPEVRDRMTHSSSFISAYSNSIHGKAVAAGNLDAAICRDCHGGHDEMKATNPRSMVNKFNITTTCGKCHDEVTAVFSESIHGTALGKGVADAPTCTDCHGEHNIIASAGSESPVAPKNVSQQVCGPCHSSVRMSEKYGLPSDRFSAFVDSYHGLAVKFGSIKAANCASCHGVHDILPISDPRSKVHPDNLAETCGSCHPGANQNFTRGRVHVMRTSEGDKLIYWISSVYVFLIIATIGSMTVHNAADWLRKIVDKYRERYGEPAIAPVKKTGKQYVRMSGSERLQHVLLLSSFAVLVVTGFMLKFPDSWWVVMMRKALGEPLFELRGYLHRIAAVVMTADAVYHLFYISLTQRGRAFIRDMKFKMQDFKDMVQVCRYNFGLAKSKPQFDRFSYIEKSEYWALVWGTVIMTLTGVALWFENQFMGWFSKLFLDVCETVHYFEAWLAFLAIVVWHIYFVVFNPDVYPMNFSWITGKLTEEEMAKEHPKELARITEDEKKAEQKEEELSDTTYPSSS